MKKRCKRCRGYNTIRYKVDNKWFVRCFRCNKVSEDNEKTT